ncbi:Bardet-Biedl syndrome 10 protein isoform X2 [Electrophorus electricus]|uniref:Bardet-Biedl syndrome 10 protein isoform X2 n=1 Tax=Electrophorus electricus TaxID=8005 RepID=UPI000F09D4BC|nr:Bardet-Biedl syndrome 10 protein isoform X2 [Electrophorus electricus]
MAKTCVSESASLQASLSVVGALECVVRRCVGPEGGSVLFTKDTGETLITRMVLECVCAHDRVTADGSKSFILLLATLLRGIRDSVNRQHKATWNLATPRNLANRLLAFCWKELDDVIDHCVVPYASSLFLLNGYRLEGRVLPALVRGYVAGRVGIGQAEILTPLLCELYNKVSDEQDHLTEEPIAFLNSNFSLLHITVSGLPTGRSQVVEGIVFARDWSVWREAPHCGPVKALIVSQCLDKPLAAVGENVSICFQQDWLLHSERIMEARLAAMLSLQAHVVLSSVKQPERMLEWARENSLAVLECMDSEQLELLCQLTAADTPPLQPMLRVVMLSFYRRLHPGGGGVAQLGIPCCGFPHAHTLVLCAPTAGALEQSMCASRGTFAMLQHLCHAVLRRTEQTSETHTLNDSCTRETERDGVCEACENHDHHDQCHIPLPDQSSSGQSRGPASPPDLWDVILKAGGVLPVGGAFEFLLHHSLLHCCNHGDTQSRRLLAEAILSMFRSLHSHKPRYFLQHHTHFMSKLQIMKLGHAVRELGSGSEFRLALRPEGPASLCVESVCSKHQLVVSVLQCVSRLLCVGAILYIPSLAQRPLTTCSEESEEENI